MVRSVFFTAAYAERVERVGGEGAGWRGPTPRGSGRGRPDRPRQVAEEDGVSVARAQPMCLSLSTEKPRSVGGRGRGSLPSGRSASVKGGERPPQMVLLRCGGVLT